MNWYGFTNLLKYKKNKIFAVSFSFFGLALLIAGYVTLLIRYGVSYFTSDLAAILDLVFYLLVFGLIFGCNVMNDNLAYQGILLFVFFTTFDAGRVVFVNIGAYASLFTSTFSLEFLPYLVYMLNMLALLVTGVITYILTNKYMRHRNVTFEKVRLFAILFAVAVLINSGLGLFFETMGEAVLIDIFLPYILIQSSMVFIAVSIVFTLERLRRI